MMPMPRARHYLARYEPSWPVVGERTRTVTSAYGRWIAVTIADTSRFARRAEIAWID